MKLVSAILCKNEADKYLERTIRRCAEYSDEVLVLDDGSTDGSDRLAWRLGCGVKKRQQPGMWGNESPARAELWDWAAEVAGDGWVIINDADMLLHGDPRPLMLSRQCNSWAWVLYDMWREDRFYRRDTFWRGHEFARPWMFRPSALQGARPEWKPRGVHCGHCPENFPMRVAIVPTHSVYWSHMAYATPELRQAKYEQYMSQAHQLSEFEYAHAASILD